MTYTQCPNVDCHKWVRVKDLRPNRHVGEPTWTGCRYDQRPYTDAVANREHRRMYGVDVSDVRFAAMMRRTDATIARLGWLA